MDMTDHDCNIIISYPSPVLRKPDSHMSPEEEKTRGQERNVRETLVAEGIVYDDLR